MKTLIIEYRDNKRSTTWKRSAMNWTADQLSKLNHAVGYEKYRVTGVEK